MNDPRFDYVTYIATTPETLWRALTDGEMTQRYWGGTRIKSDWQIGSKVELLTFDEYLANTGTVLEFEPPRRLSYTWHVEFAEKLSREAPSRVTFVLTPLGAVVRLTVTHDRFEADSEVLKRVSQGWPKMLCSLKSLLESGSSLSLLSVDAIKAARKQAIEGTQACAPAAAGAAGQPSSEFVSYIAARPEQVWQGLTDPGFTAQYFFGRRMDSDWQVGSPWKMTMEDGRTDSSGTVLESDAPRHLAISWHVEWLEEFRKLPEAKVEFQIDALGDDVCLTGPKIPPPQH